MGNNELKPAIRFKGFTDAWEQRKLGDMIDKLTGGASIAPDDYVEEGYRTIPKGAVNDTGVADMSGCKCVSEAFYQKNISSKTSAGELVTSLRDLVPTAPNMGRIVRIYGDSEDFLMPQGVYSIVLKKNSDEDFLIAYSNSPDYRRIITTEKNGSTQVHIRNGEFLNIDIPVPSYEEQKKIGATIRNLDNLITLHQRKCDKLVNLKKSMLEQMFLEDDAVVPKIRFEGFIDAWEQRKLGDLGTIQTCKRIFKEQTSDEGEIPFFKNGTIGLEADAFISRELFEEFKRLYPYPEVGDILISAVGSVGRTAEYTGKDEYFQDSNVVWLKTDGNVEKKYLKVFYQVIDWLIEGSTVKHLYNDNILRSTIVMPKDRAEQKKIGLFFEELDTLITLHQRKCDELKLIKKFMLQNMFPANRR